LPSKGASAHALPWLLAVGWALVEVTRIGARGRTGAVLVVLVHSFLYAGLFRRPAHLGASFDCGSFTGGGREENQEPTRRCWHTRSGPARPASFMPRALVWIIAASQRSCSARGSAHPAHPERDPGTLDTSSTMSSARDDPGRRPRRSPSRGRPRCWRSSRRLPRSPAQAFDLPGARPVDTRARNIEFPEYREGTLYVNAFGAGVRDRARPERSLAAHFGGTKPSSPRSTAHGHRASQTGGHGTRP
jgi:hypothetical protein